MQPRESQLVMAEQAFAILREHAIVYLAAEERTGKTIASLLTVEKCGDSVQNVLILTKKNAIQQKDKNTGELKGWLPTLNACKWLKKHYVVTNYHQARKLLPEYDLVILDEAHNYIAGYPKESGMWKAVKKLTERIPLIYISATPHAQGRQQLFHQLALSDWSPWARYKSFYAWFKHYGIASTIWISGQERPVYTNVYDDLIISGVEHLFITKTRKELGFKQEPKDKLHYIQLDAKTKDLYNTIVKHKIAYIPKAVSELTCFDFDLEGNQEDDRILVCDSPMKLRTSLHMLEGGVLKIRDKYISLWNREKIDFIFNTWGDSKDVAIFYQYIEEGNKLRKLFTRATILQGTSNAEGIDLSHIKHLIIYSQDFSTAKHTQRRARQASYTRNENITVHFLLVEHAISAQCYKIVSINKQNFVDSVFNKVEI